MAAPLQEQCYLKLLLSIEEYSPEVLSWLPLRMRRRLLSALPLADLDMLEETPFSRGINFEEEVWKERYDEILHMLNDLKLILPYSREAKIPNSENCRDILLFLILHHVWPYTRFPIRKLLFSLRTHMYSQSNIVPPRYRIRVLPLYGVGSNCSTVDLLRSTIALLRRLPTRLHIECSFFRYSVFWKQDWGDLLQLLVANMQHFSCSVLSAENEPIATYLFDLVTSNAQSSLQSVSISW